MNPVLYKALVVEESEGQFSQTVRQYSTDNLPKGDVLVRVHYSSVNYKDALSATGNKGITKQYPHTPGIDAAGIVEHSDDSRFAPGDEVIVTGNDLGMNTAGGFGQYICVPADWVVKLPVGLTMKEAMIIGTAGFTAAISLLRLSQFVQPNDGEIVVTGATGGVGSMALSLLAKLGYKTVAVSGKESEYEFLQQLGANEIISRSAFEQVDKRPILSARFAGAIDAVGGPILENILKALKPLGAVTTCGSVSSTNLNMTVFPFILRGITLMGISAQNYPMALRQDLWNKLGSEWHIAHLESLCNEVTLEQLPTVIESILQGQLKGRTIVNMNA